MSLLSALFSVLLVVMGLAAAAVLAAFFLIVKAAVSQEAASVLPEATRNLLERAKDRLPEEGRARWEEEWPAAFERAIEKRPIWAFREAISLYLGSRRIAKALQPAAAPAEVHEGQDRDRVASSLAAGAGQLLSGLSKVSSTLRKVLVWLDAAFERAFGSGEGAARRLFIAGFALAAVLAGIIRLVSLILGWLGI
jgi:hypothetical protein